MNLPAPSACFPLPPFTEREFRNALGQFATGVTVVTTVDAAGQRTGMTVSSFNAVSLAPPLVLWSLGHQSGTYPVFAQCTHYAIHVLAGSQQDLARQFAQRGVDRFAGVDCTPNAHGVPLIAGALATFECRVRSRYDEGDHLIMVGEVQACHSVAGPAPLVYHAGQMHTGPLA